MGSRGPAAKSTAQSAIRFRKGIPPPPDWLDDAAKEEYRRGAKELTAADGAAQQMDLAALATYAQAYSDVARLTMEIRKEGEVVNLTNGVLAPNPRIAVRKQAQSQLLQAMGQLGFSPAARARVPRSAATGEANPFQEFVK